MQSDLVPGMTSNTEPHQVQDEAIITIRWRQLWRRMTTPWGMLFSAGLLSLLGAAVLFFLYENFLAQCGIFFDWIFYGFLISRLFAPAYRHTRPVKSVVISLLLSGLIFFAATVVAVFSGLAGGAGLWLAPGPGVGIAYAASEYVQQRSYHQRQDEENASELSTYHGFLSRYQEAAPIVTEMLDATCKGPKTSSCPSGRYLSFYTTLVLYNPESKKDVRIPIPLTNKKYVGQMPGGGLIEGVSDARACTTVCEQTVYDLTVVNDKTPEQ